MAVYTTIDNPELYFQVKTYTGNGTAIGSGGQAVTLDGDTDMQPDLVWIKDRSDADRPRWFDAVRGVTKSLDSSDTSAEDTNSEYLTAFGSNGFTVGNHEGINSSGDSFVAWCWKESATAGFDIVSYTGNSTSGATISHNLGVAPKIVIIKARERGDSWVFGHDSLGWTKFLYLDTTNSVFTITNRWNDTAPTSSVITLGNATDVNYTDDFIAYAFAEKQGFSSAFKFTGNGNSNGPFVWCNGIGNIAFLMIKRSDSTSDWHIYDNKRSDSGGGNPNDQYLEADTSNAEASGLDVDFVAGGFKIRSSSADINASGGTYIGFAVASAPFVNSNGVPCNAR